MGQGFSIEKDEQYGILACVKRLQEEAEKAGVTPFFFASPWSPPGWMKKPTRKSTHYKHNDAKLKGGRLDSRYLPDYARYLTRYLEEYEKRGISVSALTLQNEALFETCYPSCLVFAGTRSRTGPVAPAGNQEQPDFAKARWPCGCMITILPRRGVHRTGRKSRCHGVVRRVCPARL